MMPGKPCSYLTKEYTMKSKVLELLKHSDDYISGQRICEQLGVSRTAVWKVMNRLREEGYVIDSVNNKGYKLLSCPDLLSEDLISSSLHERQTDFIQKVVYLPDVDSTNTYAKSAAEHGLPDRTLVTADRQTSGKGRRGRSFSSPGGVGIFMTLLLKPDIPPLKASMLTLPAGMAVCQALREITGIPAMIKWPNDIVVNGKKVCGILTEMSTEEDAIRYVVVGIGINANTTDFPEEIRATATSLALELGHPVCRAAVINGVMCAFEEYYGRYRETLDMSLLKELYNQKLVNAEREVKVLAPGGDYTGISHGINDAGELIVELPDGSIREINSGEVSVRGIYGYV